MERPLNADLVENPFDIESDVGLKGLRVRQQWDDKIVKYIEQENIQALYLYTDWRGTDYSFLKHLPGIKKLHILSGRESHNISAIEGMIGLENLNVKWITKEKVDFSRLTRLRDCVLTWWPGARSIFQAKSLVQLSLDEFRTSDYEELGQLDGLRKLKISNSGIQDIRFLPALGKLERLELINCKKVSDFAPISRLPHLKWLSIDGASQMGSVDFLAGLKRIEYFNFSRCNEIGTIKPLGQLKTLKAVFFLGDTNIKDGDLAPLAKLPVLAILGFNDRKHYSHRLIKPYKWSDWDKPDKLLDENRGRWTIAMDLFETNLCWDLIEQSRADGAEAHLAALRQLLSERTPEEILRFDQCVAEWMARSYSHDLWLAFYVIRGGCSDDSFDYCRQWLILQGRILYENALKNPDSLADLEETGETEELLSLARDVYEEKTGTDLLGQSYPDYGLQGEDWSEDDLEAMKRRVPRLFEKYW